MTPPYSPGVPFYPHGALSLFTGACSAHVRKCKIYSLAIYAAHPHLSAKFNHELRYKNQKPSNKAPDKILRRKIKIGSDKLAQKPDFEAKFYAQLLKKAAI